MEQILQRSTTEEPTLWAEDNLEEVFRDQKDPIQFRLIGALLWMADDQDWMFPHHSRHSAAKGVKLGHNTVMPRTPAVFEKKQKWKKYDPELLDGDPLWGKNYISAEQNLPAIKRQFAEEEKEGMMIRC